MEHADSQMWEDSLTNDGRWFRPVPVPDVLWEVSHKFASVMDSAAVRTRRGWRWFPARDPMALPHVAEAWRRNAVPVNDTVNDDDPGDDDDYPTLAGVLQTTIDRAMPLVNHAVNTKVLGLSTEQSIALMGGNAGASPPAAPPAAKKQAAAASASSHASKAPPVPDFVPHLLAVEAQLTKEEVGLARAAAMQMPPAAMVAWRDKILAMSPTDAAAMIRAEVNKGTTKTGSGTEPQTKEAV